MVAAMETLSVFLQSQALHAKTWLLYCLRGLLFGFGHEAPVVQAAICLTFNCAIWCVLVAALRRFTSQEEALNDAGKPHAEVPTKTKLEIDWKASVPELKTDLSTIEEQPSKEDDREIAARLLQSMWRDLQASQDLKKRTQQNQKQQKSRRGHSQNSSVRGDSKEKGNIQPAITQDIYQQALAVAQAKASSSGSVSSEPKATPQLCSGEASRTALGGRIAKALNSSSSNKTTTTTHKDCFDLISAFNKDPTAIVEMVAKDATRTVMQKHKEQQQQKLSLHSASRSSSHKLGFQVNTALKVRTQTLAAIVLQSWVRMMICRSAYREVFSSLITAPIANLPSTSTSRVGSPTTITTTTQQHKDPLKSKNSSETNPDAPSIVSSLSSWSSTWNKKKSTMVPPTSISTPKTATAPTKATKQPPVQDTSKSNIRSNLPNAASILQHIPTLWRAATTCDSNLETADTPPTTQAQHDSNNMTTSHDEDDSVLEEDGNFVRRFESRRRRRKSTGYDYSGLWQSTLERVGECNTMCEALEERGAAAVKCQDNATAASVLSCQNTVVCSGEDGKNYEVVLTSPTGEGLLGCHSAIPPLCTMPRSRSLQDVTQAASSAAPASQAKTEKVHNKTNTHKKTQGGLRCNNPGIYYVPTATSADYAVGEDANLFSFSAPTQTTFSSKSTYEEDDSWTAKHPETRKGLDYAFCTAPPVTTSSSESGASTTDSDYFSVDHSATLDDGPSLSYQPSVMTGPTQSIDAVA